MAILTIAGTVCRYPETFSYMQNGKEKTGCRFEVREGYGRSINYFEITVFGERIVQIALHLDQNDPVKVECDLTTRMIESEGGRRKVLNLTARQIQCLNFEAFGRRWGQTHSDVEGDGRRPIRQSQVTPGPKIPDEKDFSLLLDMEDGVEEAKVSRIDEIDQLDW